MTDTFAAAPGAADPASGVARMSRLADRLAAVTPPAQAASLAAPREPLQLRMSPAVEAGLRTARAIAARADARARRSRSITGTLIDGFVALCAFIPYALVALALRLVTARVFFLEGQVKVDGPRVPLDIQGFDFTLVLPLQVRAETVTTFLTTAALPVPPVLAAYVVAYAEVLLPLMLLIGFGTRIAALGLLAVTVLMQIYLMPHALWSAHVYWAAMLLVLISLGPGQLSIDHFIRLARQR
jgi:putative oxidoreductase